MLSTPLKSERGFTLLESLIALGIIGMISLAVMQFISQASDNQLFIDAVSNRMAASQSLTKAISKMDTLKKSADIVAPGNQELRRCLDTGPGSSPGLCTSVGEANKKSFYLLAADGRRAAGTDSDPVLYNRRGAVCQTGESGCPFYEAKSYFWVTCPLDAKGKPSASCDQASSMSVKYTYNPVGEGLVYLGRTMKSVEGKVMHRVVDQIVKPDQQCPPGAELKGVGADGTVSCRCRAGYSQDPAAPAGIVSCQTTTNTTCAADELLVGRMANGAPKCLYTQPRCSTKNFDDQSATCPAGGWLQSIDLGRCKPKPADKKADSRTIQCDRNKGVCCRYVY